MPAKRLRCVRCGEWLTPKMVKCPKCKHRNTGVTHKSQEYSAAFYSRVCCVTDKFFPKGGLVKVYVKNKNKIMEYWIDPKVELSPPDDTVPVYSFNNFKESVGRARAEIEEQKKSESNGGEMS